MRTDHKDKPKKDPKCPICEKMYRFIHGAEYVCSNHEHWFVTRCSGCHRYVFSDARSICPDCSPTDLRPDPKL